MKHWIPKRRWAAVLMMAVTLAFVASAAVAGSRSGNRRSHAPAKLSASISWRSGDIVPIGFGGVAIHGRRLVSARPVREEACVVEHEPHVWYDGRLWCSGKNADGSWRGPWHCEDEYGRKKVNLASFDPGCEKWVSVIPR